MDQLDTGGRIATGEPVVIDEAIFERVESERRLVVDLRFSEVELVDPWDAGVSIGALTGADLKGALDEAGRIQRAYDDLDGSIQKLSNEVNAAGELLRSFDDESRMLYELQRAMEPYLAELSILEEQLPYWYFDVENLYAAMNLRESELAGRLRGAKATLRDARRWRSEHEARRRDVDRWVERIIEAKIAADQRERFDAILRRVDELAGARAPTSAKRRLAGVLTAITANNERIREEAGSLRAEADAIRSQSNVGKDMFDLLLKLASIGSGMMSDNSSSGGQSPSRPDMSVSPEPNSILLDAGTTIVLDVKYENQSRTYRRGRVRNDSGRR
ncbi:hypothetical protein [Bradyrhizobium japonicum]|uniref:hypothetical protein n=1 Tax=Bradyrhizobium japonicum TaxID=375 RepID=UPI0012BC4915|nr:hypothetical protein [Bradyrhizobium japonicum]WLB95994.1 hypothetical protein QIH92_41195 [Bradyrhizobium japonicum USDA 123]